MSVQLYNDDLFNVIDSIEPESIDLILTDFPYGILNKKRNG